MIPIHRGRGGSVTRTAEVTRIVAAALICFRWARGMLVEKGARRRQTSMVPARRSARNHKNTLEKNDSGEGRLAAVQGGPLTDIHFGYNDYTVQPQDSSILRANATWLQDHPGTETCRSKATAMTAGRRSTTSRSGAKRAQSAKDYLTTLGISPSRISTISYGKELPICHESGRKLLAAKSSRSLRRQRQSSRPLGATTLRFSSIAICAGMIMVLGLFAGCSDESSNINQLNQNEFALRGMIASDRQQIDALRADLKRTQDDLAEMKHGSGESAAAAAPADVNDRLAKLESEVNALQVALPTAPAPVAGTEPPGTSLRRARRRFHRRRAPASLRQPRRLRVRPNRARPPRPPNQRRPGRKTSTRKSPISKTPKSQARRFIAKASMP